MMAGKITIFAKVEEHDDLETRELIEVLNLQTRELTDMERSDAVKRLESIVKERKKQGVDYGGKKTREIVADMISTNDNKVNPATVQKLLKIQNLIPEFKELAKNGELPLEKANQFAQMSEEQQKLVYEMFQAGKELTAKDAKALKDDMKKGDEEKAIEKMKDELKRKEEELQKAKQEAQEEKEKLKAVESEKDSIQKKLDSLNSTLDEIRVESDKKQKELEAAKEKLRADIEKEVKKSVKEENSKKLKELQDQLKEATEKQNSIQNEYQKKLEAVEKELDERKQEQNKKRIEEDKIEGNMKIVALGRQAQKVLNTLIEMVGEYTKKEGFELDAQTKEVLQEISKYESDIVNKG